MQDLRVADRQRNCSFAYPACHYRHDDKEEGVEGPQSQERSDHRADDPTGDRPSGKRDEDLEETLDQDTAIHTDDDAGDEEVEEIGVLGELRHRAEDGSWQQMMKGEERGDEGGKNRGGADIADDRDALTQLGTGEAAHRQQDDSHRNVGRHAPGERIEGDHRDQNHEDRQGDDADLEIDNRPPAGRPEARSCGQGWSGKLQILCVLGQISSSFLYVSLFGWRRFSVAAYANSARRLLWRSSSPQTTAI